MSGRERILVTGGAGFIGANLLRVVLNKSDDVELLNVDALTYAGNHDSIADLDDDPRYRFSRADIRDLPALRALFAEFRPTAVIHLAAESHVDRSISGPAVFIETNVQGTFCLLEAAREHWQTLGEGPKERFRLLGVSTDEVFGSLGDEGAFDEESPYDPSSPYSASKAAADHLLRAYQRTYGLPTIVTNCSNNYGPYQFPEKLIPLMIQRALAGEPLPVYGKGQNVRDWLYVEDHCEALWTVLQRGDPGRTYAIGGGVERKNIDLVEELCARLEAQRPSGENPSLNLAGVSAYRELIRFVADRPGHDHRYAIDARRMEVELGWRPRESFDSGMDKTIAWYLRNRTWVERVTSGEYRRWIERHYADPGDETP